LVAGGINQHRNHASGKKDRTEQIFKMIVAPDGIPFRDDHRLRVRVRADADRVTIWASARANCAHRRMGCLRLSVRVG